jgi:hypothetical protein
MGKTWGRHGTTMGKTWGRYGEDVMDGTWGRWMGYWGKGVVAMTRVEWWAGASTIERHTCYNDGRPVTKRSGTRNVIHGCRQIKQAPQAPETREIVSHADGVTPRKHSDVRIVSRLSPNKASTASTGNSRNCFTDGQLTPVSIQMYGFFRDCRHITQAPQALETREIVLQMDSVNPKHCGTPDVSRLSTYNASRRRQRRQPGWKTDMMGG